MKRLLTMILVLLTFVLSCGGKKAESTDGAKKVTLGVTYYKFDDNFLAGMRNDMIAIAKEKYPNIELLNNDSQNSQSILNDQIDVLINKGVDVLVINLVDPTAGQQVINKAKAANIPIVLFNKDPGVEALNSYDKAWYVGTTPKDSGILQGQVIEKAWLANPAYDLNGDVVIQYVMLFGEPGQPDAEARTKYSIEYLNGKGIKTEELHKDIANWDAAQAKDKMDAWLSGPNANKIEVVIANNDGMALGAVESVKAFKKKLPVFGVDAIQEALTLIEKGEMVGTVLQDATGQARAILELANNIANGKEPTEGTEWKLVDKAVRVPYVGVDKDNYKEYQK
ncbi:galactose/glucose ABC transporter substrate-binding protein MglB [Streptobacillus notomytis]|uniref:galactose/glucose ABC transporter substrate-binding protein MglB n=1 Tax=Streptobacillus notomytis TaxID=1712031 RepID=UPI0009376873